MVKLIFYGEQVPEDNVLTDSIFLAGPTKRNSDFNHSWRKEAVYFLNTLGFSGYVFIPEYRDGSMPKDDSEEAWKIIHKWEWENLSNCSVIAFWIPRDSQNDMPGFTTNVEFGFWVATDPYKVVLGYPKSADRMGYLQDLYDEYAGFNEVYDSLENTMKVAIETIDKLNESESIEEASY